MATRRTFEDATARRDELSARVDEASATLQTFPEGGGPFGLRAESVRMSPEYRAAREAFGLAMENMRRFNVVYVAEFPREIRAARDARRQRMADNLARLRGETVP